MKSNAKTVFKNIQKKLLAVQRVAPRVLANEGVKAFMDNFKTESYEGDKWEKRKRENKYKRPILIGKTRNLKNATNTSVKEANTHRIRWANWVPYAAIHNYGETVNKGDHSRNKTIKTKVYGSGSFVNGKYKRGRGKTLTLLGESYGVSAHSFQMPHRQFMGAGPMFRRRIRMKYASMYRQALK